MAQGTYSCLNYIVDFEGQSESKRHLFKVYMYLDEGAALPIADVYVKNLC